jgi:hypothetical protein
MRWEQLLPSVGYDITSPIARHSHSTIALDNRVIGFGGDFDGNLLNDIISFEMGSYNQVHTIGFMEAL